MVRARACRPGAGAAGKEATLTGEGEAGGAARSG